MIVTQAPLQKSSNRRGEKSAAAFRTISEVAGELDLPQHVLRFWETKFPQVRPLKRGGGRRYYRPEDVQLLRRIRFLLYDDGYTIRGVQKLLRQDGAKGTAEAAPEAPPGGAGTGTDGADTKALVAAHRRELEAVLAELETLRAMLSADKD